jgi:hypothetical protein
MIVVKVAQSRCVRSGTLFEDVKAIVNVNSEQPGIKIEGFENRLYQPSEKIPFRVEIYDPSLAQSEKPQPLQFAFNERHLNAGPAIQCPTDGQPTGVPNTFKFSCTFDMGELAKQNPSGPQIAAFSVFVRSARGEESVHVPVRVFVSFPVKEVKDRSVTVPPAPQPQTEKIPLPRPKPAKLEPSQTSEKKLKSRGDST